MPPKSVPKTATPQKKGKRQSSIQPTHNAPPPHQGNPSASNTILGKYLSRAVPTTRLSLDISARTEPSTPQDDCFTPMARCSTVSQEDMALDMHNKRKDHGTVARRRSLKAVQESSMDTLPPKLQLDSENSLSDDLPPIDMSHRHNSVADVLGDDDDDDEAMFPRIYHSQLEADDFPPVDASSSVPATHGDHMGRQQQQASLRPPPTPAPIPGHMATSLPFLSEYDAHTSAEPQRRSGGDGNHMAASSTPSRALPPAAMDNESQYEVTPQKTRHSVAQPPNIKETLYNLQMAAAQDDDDGGFGTPSRSRSSLRGPRNGQAGAYPPRLPPKTPLIRRPILRQSPKDTPHEPITRHNIPHPSVPPSYGGYHKGQPPSGFPFPGIVMQPTQGHSNTDPNSTTSSNSSSNLNSYPDTTSSLRHPQYRFLHSNIPRPTPPMLGRLADRHRLSGADPHSSGSLHTSSARPIQHDSAGGALQYSSHHHDAELRHTLRSTGSGFRDSAASGGVDDGDQHTPPQQTGNGLKDMSGIMASPRPPLHPPSAGARRSIPPPGSRFNIPDPASSSWASRHPHSGAGVSGVGGGGGGGGDDSLDHRASSSLPSLPQREASGTATSAFYSSLRLSQHQPASESGTASDPMFLSRMNTLDFKNNMDKFSVTNMSKRRRPKYTHMVSKPASNDGGGDSDSEDFPTARKPGHLRPLSEYGRPFDPASVTSLDSLDGRDVPGGASRPTAGSYSAAGFIKQSQLQPLPPPSNTVATAFPIPDLDRFVTMPSVTSAKTQCNLHTLFTGLKHMRRIPEKASFASFMSEINRRVLKSFHSTIGPPPPLPLVNPLSAFKLLSRSPRKTNPYQVLFDLLQTIRTEVYDQGIATYFTHASFTCTMLYTNIVSYIRHETRPALAEGVDDGRQRGMADKENTGNSASHHHIDFAINDQGNSTKGGDRDNYDDDGDGDADSLSHHHHHHHHRTIIPPLRPTISFESNAQGVPFLHIDFVPSQLLPIIHILQQYEQESPLDSSPGFSRQVSTATTSSTSATPCKLTPYKTSATHPSSAASSATSSATPSATPTYPGKDSEGGDPLHMFHPGSIFSVQFDATYGHFYCFYVFSLASDDIPFAELGVKIFSTGAVCGDIITTFDISSPQLSAPVGLAETSVDPHKALPLSYALQRHITIPPPQPPQPPPPVPSLRSPSPRLIHTVPNINTIVNLAKGDDNELTRRLDEMFPHSFLDAHAKANTNASLGVAGHGGAPNGDNFTDFLKLNPPVFVPSEGATTPAPGEHDGDQMLWAMAYPDLKGGGNGNGDGDGDNDLSSLEYGPYPHDELLRESLQALQLHLFLRARYIEGLASIDPTSSTPHPSPTSPSPRDTIDRCPPFFYPATTLTSQSVSPDNTSHSVHEQISHGIANNSAKESSFIPGRVIGGGSQGTVSLCYSIQDGLLFVQKVSKQTPSGRRVSGVLYEDLHEFFVPAHIHDGVHAQRQSGSHRHLYPTPVYSGALVKSIPAVLSTAATSSSSSPSTTTTLGGGYSLQSSLSITPQPIHMDSPDGHPCLFTKSYCAPIIRPLVYSHSSNSLTVYSEYAPFSDAYSTLLSNVQSFNVVGGSVLDNPLKSPPHPSILGITHMSAPSWQVAVMLLAFKDIFAFRTRQFYGLVCTDHFLHSLFGRQKNGCMDNDDGGDGDDTDSDVKDRKDIGDDDETVRGSIVDQDAPATPRTPTKTISHTRVSATPLMEQQHTPLVSPVKDTPGGAHISNTDTTTDASADTTANNAEPTPEPPFSADPRRCLDFDILTRSIRVNNSFHHKIFPFTTVYTTIFAWSSCYRDWFASNRAKIQALYTHILLTISQQSDHASGGVPGIPHHHHLAAVSPSQESTTKKAGSSSLTSLSSPPSSSPSANTRGSGDDKTLASFNLDAAATSDKPTLEEVLKQLHFISSSPQHRFSIPHTLKPNSSTLTPFDWLLRLPPLSTTSSTPAPSHSMYPAQHIIANHEACRIVPILPSPDDFSSTHPISCAFTSLFIFSQMANAIGQCHSQSIVHMDIKPENFLLTPSASYQDTILRSQLDENSDVMSDIKIFSNEQLLYAIGLDAGVVLDLETVFVKQFQHKQREMEFALNQCQQQQEQQHPQDGSPDVLDMDDAVPATQDIPTQDFPTQDLETPSPTQGKSTQRQGQYGAEGNGTPHSNTMHARTLSNDPTTSVAPTLTSSLSMTMGDGDDDETCSDELAPSKPPTNNTPALSPPSGVFPASSSLSLSSPSLSTPLPHAPDVVSSIASSALLEGVYSTAKPSTASPTSLHAPGTLPLPRSNPLLPSTLNLLTSQNSLLLDSDLSLLPLTFTSPTCPHSTAELFDKCNPIDWKLGDFGHAVPYDGRITANARRDYLHHLVYADSVNEINSALITSTLASSRSLPPSRVTTPTTPGSATTTTPSSATSTPSMASTQAQESDLASVIHQSFARIESPHAAEQFIHKQLGYLADALLEFHSLYFQNIPQPISPMATPGRLHIHSTTAATTAAGGGGGAGGGVTEMDQRSFSHYAVAGGASSQALAPVAGHVMVSMKPGRKQERVPAHVKRWDASIQSGNTIRDPSAITLRFQPTLLDNITFPHACLPNPTTEHHNYTVSDAALHHRFVSSAITTSKFHGMLFRSLQDVFTKQSANSMIPPQDALSSLLRTVSHSRMPSSGGVVRMSTPIHQVVSIPHTTQSILNKVSFIALTAKYHEGDRNYLCPSSFSSQLKKTPSYPPTKQCSGPIADVILSSLSQLQKTPTQHRSWNEGESSQPVRVYQPSEKLYCYDCQEIITKELVNQKQSQTGHQAAYSNAPPIHLPKCFYCASLRSAVHSLSLFMQNTTPTASIHGYSVPSLLQQQQHHTCNEIWKLMSSSPSQVTTPTTTSGASLSSATPSPQQTAHQPNTNPSIAGSTSAGGRASRTPSPAPLPSAHRNKFMTMLDSSHLTDLETRPQYLCRIDNPSHFASSLISYPAYNDSVATLDLRDVYSVGISVCHIYSSRPPAYNQSSAEPTIRLNQHYQNVHPRGVLFPQSSSGYAGAIFSSRSSSDYQRFIGLHHLKLGKSLAPLSYFMLITPSAFRFFLDTQREMYRSSLRQAAYSRQAQQQQQQRQGHSTIPSSAFLADLTDTPPIPPIPLVPLSFKQFISKLTDNLILLGCILPPSLLAYLSNIDSMEHYHDNNANSCEEDGDHDHIATTASQKSSSSTTTTSSKNRDHGSATPSDDDETAITHGDIRPLNLSALFDSSPEAMLSSPRRSHITPSKTFPHTSLDSFEHCIHRDSMCMCSSYTQHSNDQALVLGRDIAFISNIYQHLFNEDLSPFQAMAPYNHKYYQAVLDYHNSNNTDTSSGNANNRPFFPSPFKRVPARLLEPQHSFKRLDPLSSLDDMNIPVILPNVPKYPCLLSSITRSLCNSGEYQSSVDFNFHKTLLRLNYTQQELFNVNFAAAIEKYYTSLSTSPEGMPQSTSPSPPSLPQRPPSNPSLSVVRLELCSHAISRTINTFLTPYLHLLIRQSMSVVIPSRPDAIQIHQHITAALKHVIAQTHHIMLFVQQLIKDEVIQLVPVEDVSMYVPPIPASASISPSQATRFIPFPPNKALAHHKPRSATTANPPSSSSPPNVPKDHTSAAPSINTRILSTTELQKPSPSSSFSSESHDDCTPPCAPVKAVIVSPLGGGVIHTPPPFTIVSLEPFEPLLPEGVLASSPQDQHTMGMYDGDGYSTDDDTREMDDLPTYNEITESYLNYCHLNHIESVKDLNSPLQVDLKVLSAYSTQPQGTGANGAPSSSLPRKRHGKSTGDSLGRVRDRTPLLLLKDIPDSTISPLLSHPLQRSPTTSILHHGSPTHPSRLIEEGPSSTSSREADLHDDDRATVTPPSSTTAIYDVCHDADLDPSTEIHPISIYHTTKRPQPLTQLNIPHSSSQSPYTSPRITSKDYPGGLSSPVHSLQSPSLRTFSALKPQYVSQIHGTPSLSSTHLLSSSSFSTSATGHGPLSRSGFSFHFQRSTPSLTASTSSSSSTLKPLPSLSSSGGSQQQQQQQQQDHNEHLRIVLDTSPSACNPLINLAHLHQQITQSIANPQPHLQNAAQGFASSIASRIPRYTPATTVSGEHYGASQLSNVFAMLDKRLTASSINIDCFEYAMFNTILHYLAEAIERVAYGIDTVLDMSSLSMRASTPSTSRKFTWVSKIL